MSHARKPRSVAGKPAATRTKPKAKTVGIRIDIETRSSVPIKVGSYRYADDPDFKVLTICYTPIRKYEDGTTRLGKIRPLNLGDGTVAYTEQAQFRRMLADPRFQKHAFNANFERIALSKWMGMPTGMYL